MSRLVGAVLIAVPLSLTSCDKSPQGSEARGGNGAAASGGDGGAGAATNGGQTGVGGASGGAPSAGSAGKGGSAGAGGGAGGEPSDAPAWILDAARWTQLPGTSFTEPGCQFRWTDQADLPPLSWTSCGVGCEQAALDSSLSYGIATTLSVDTRDGGVTTLGSIRRIIRLPQWNVAVSYALSMTGGERIGSVLRYDVPASSTEAVCGFGFPSESASNNLIWGTDNGAHKQLNIWAPTRTTDWQTVGKPASLAVPGKFAFDLDWDGGRLVGLGGNVVMPSPIA